jgi:hypothetical protein
MSDEAVKTAEEAPESTEVKPTIAQTAGETQAQAAPAEEKPAEVEDVHYQAVEKDGTVTAIWEMQGQKHLRTIDPRSHEGKQILALFETAA